MRHPAHEHRRTLPEAPLQQIPGAPTTRVDLELPPQYLGLGLLTVGGQRKTRYRGEELVGWMFELSLAAYNLV